MVKKLRIAHVSATFPPYQGGTGNVCYYNARQLARLGHEVHVFTAAFQDAPALESIDAITIHRLRPIIQVGNAPFLPQLFKVLRCFDLVHLHCPFISGAELTALAAKYFKTPLVATYHSDFVLSGGWRDSLFSIATRSSRVVLRRADRLLFVSEGHARTCDARAIYEKYPDHCQVVPNGIDTALFRPSSDQDTIRAELGLSKGDKVVGFVGALDRAHHYKGLEVLLEIMSSKALEDAYLLIIGNGDRRDHYEQIAIRLGIPQRVRFTGGVKQELLPPFYRACDVVAMPSKAPESFGLVAAEALACGVTVVASDCPGIHSLIENGDYGYLVRPNDRHDLAIKLKFTLSLPADKRLAMGLSGRRNIKAKYDWHLIGCALETIYSEVLLDRVRTRQRKK